MDEKYNPAKDPIWDKVGDKLKPILNMVDGSLGIMMVERKGAVAAIVLGKEDMDDCRRVKASLELFRERLEEIIAGVDSEKLDASLESRKFLRNMQTGEFEEQS